MNESNCTYCKRPLGNSYTFSYGIPGIHRVYGCNRRFCVAMRKFQKEKNTQIRALVKRLNQMIKD